MLIFCNRFTDDEAFYTNLNALNDAIGESSVDPPVTADGDVVQKALTELRTWTLACNGEPKRWYQ